jgi:thioredoxin 1
LLVYIVFIIAPIKIKIKFMLKVLKFSASWCGPCKQLSPIFDQVKSEVSGVSFQDVDVDADSALAIKYNVRGVPTIIIEKNGQEVKRLVGMQQKPVLTSTINSFK